LSKEEGYVEINGAIHEWTNYVKCGFKGICQDLSLVSAPVLDILVDGTVPKVINVYIHCYKYSDDVIFLLYFFPK